MFHVQAYGAELQNASILQKPYQYGYTLISSHDSFTEARRAKDEYLEVKRIELLPTFEDVFRYWLNMFGANPPINARKAFNKEFKGSKAKAIKGIFALRESFKHNLQYQ